MMGGSDDHNTCPGSYMDMWYPGDGGRRDFYRSSGLTGVMARELTREALWEALRARRCYATAGERFLVDFRIDGALMGTEIESERPNLEATVVGTSKLREVVVVRNGEEWLKAEPKGTECRLEVTDEPSAGVTSYYLRAIDSTGDAAWSSPIWVRRG